MKPKPNRNWKLLAIAWDVPKGWHVCRAIEHAIALANEKNCAVCFDFNDTPIRVWADTDKESAYRWYCQARQFIQEMLSDPKKN